jgi:zinc transport system substrate-binding protein
VKRYVAVLLVMTAFFSFSCRGKEDTGNGKIKIAVTILPYSGIVKEIGGDKVDVAVLVPPQSACETYEPTPVDVAKAAKAEIYFSVGANYAFEKNLMKGITENYKNMEVVNCSNGIEVKGNNPHVWLYPAGLKIIAEHVYTSLKKVRPELENYFRLNKERFFKQIDSVDAAIKTELAPLKGAKILVFHPSWYYLASNYGLEQIAIEEEGKEPTAQDLKQIVDMARKFNIKTLFLEPNTSEESAEAIKEELKADSALLNPMEENILGNLIQTAKKISGSLKR